MARNLMKSGTDWMRRQMKAHASEWATYSHNGLSCRLQVWGGSPSATTSRNEAAEIPADIIDWMCSARDLRPGGSIAEPKPGGVLTVNGIAYQVAQNHPDGTHRYSDAGRTIIRIHTTKA